MKSKQVAERELVIDGVVHRVRVFAPRPLDREAHDFMAVRDDSRGPAQRFLRESAPRRVARALPWA